ncbi:uncharacterized protein [Henckelia pumila]|uniref:uncharacterized protein n=1 Tax=Henckelia pumila TaxID=405737 RepID=UPI003C6E575D
MSTKEETDSGVSRRRGSAPKVGSVWETRMKLDQVKGGIKVFDATHQIPQENAQIACSSTSISASPVNDTEPIGTVDKQSPVGGGRGSGSASAKRKTWKSDGLEGSPIRIGVQRSEVSKNLDDKFREFSDGNAKKSPVQTRKTRSVSVQLRKVKSDSSQESREGNSELGKVEIEELGGSDKIPLGEKSSNADEIKNTDEEEEEEENGKKIEGEIAEKDLEIKEISLQENKQKNLEIEEISLQENKQKKLLLGNKKSVPISPIAKIQLPPAVNHAKFHQNPTKIDPIPDSDDDFHGVTRTHSKLQSFADLIMWRDVAKSSFVFGIGTFAIISSSYTKDLNISFISVVSYLGLAYLVVNFLFRSLISRGTIDNNTIEDYVIGEEEAIWGIKLVLPYVNEFLLKLRALFSGDPSTTMKLAVLLFVLARCGSYITMWKMAKLGFIGVFTVPKVCSSYSVQITAYGTFWIRRFSDAWESCSHKKAVGFAIFSLVWNLSSVIARIWTVFMLFVAFKCYQHSLIRDECERGGREEDGRSAAKIRQIRDPSLQEARKPKKVC